MLEPTRAFSTVHLSDTEIGSAWEEVSDGGTIAPSTSAGGALLRTASPLRALSTTTAAEGEPQSGQTIQQELWNGVRSQSRIRSRPSRS